MVISTRTGRGILIDRYSISTRIFFQSPGSQVRVVWYRVYVSDSVAYPRFFFIPDPDFFHQQKRGVKKICHIFLCSHKFHKIEHYFSFEVLKKQIWANFQRIIELFTQNIVTKLSKIWVWDLGSGIRKKPIPDPGVKKTPDPGSGSVSLSNT